MLLREGEAFRRAALHNAPSQFEELNKKVPMLRRGMAPSVDHAIDTGQVSHTLDAAAEEPDAPIVRYAGARTLLDVPMLKANEAIGILCRKPLMNNGASADYFDRVRLCQRRSEERL